MAAKTMKTFMIAMIMSSFLVAGLSMPASAQSGGQTPLTDLQPDSFELTDRASAAISIVEEQGSTMITLTLSDLHAAFAGLTLGAHFHIGPCIAGDGAAAGPHYNSGGQPPVNPNRTTEVWLDFEVTNDGTAFSTTEVPFIIPMGHANSLVIHERATAVDGSAGASWACMDILQERPIENPFASFREAGGSINLEGDYLVALGGLAHTGSDLTAMLTIVGAALVVAGSILVRLGSTRRQD